MKPVASKTVSREPSRFFKLVPPGLLPTLVTTLLVPSSVLAAGQVSSVSISEQPATPFSYSAGGADYNWGRGNNQLIDGFTVNGRTYSYALSANEVLVQRDDIPDVATGEPCGIFVEELEHSERSHTLAADFPSDGSAAGNCDLQSLLDSRIINRGLVDAFSNNRPDAKNIERLDYLFFFGALAPLTADQLGMAGHIVAEKSGNNPVKIAAILSLDEFGQPAQYGPLVLISAAGCSDPNICYGATDLVHNYSFLQNEFTAPQSFPVETERSTEKLDMAFVSAADLGLAPGQRYFGVSIFADDVTADVHDLVDPRTFPDDTSDDFIVPGDDADIYGGLTGYYLADDVNIISGAVFLDVDLDGIRDPDEAGISDISVSIFNDANGNGLLDAGDDEQLGDSLLSNVDGTFVFPGLPDGNFLVVLDEDDAQIPAGLIVASGTNPQPLTIGGADSDPVGFPFVSESGTGSGSGNDDADGSGDGINDDGTGDGGAGGDGTNGDGTGDGDAGGDGINGDGTGDGDAGGDGTNGDGTGDGDAGGDGTDGDGTGDGDAGGDGTDGDGTGDGDAGGDGTNGDGTGDGDADGDGTDGDGTGDGDADGDGTDGDGTGDGTGGSVDEPMADDATAANSDSFEINQGQAATLDVLANDIDGAGGGLTLEIVTESPNATISITDDNQVLYEPDPGFFSQPGQPDTFMYTLQDADGTQNTGNVSVTVIRFSDLNNNMLNDFVECDCTDLSLETGVDGTGIGSLSRFMLFALGAWFMLMRFPALRSGVARGLNGRASR